MMPLVVNIILTMNWNFNLKQYQLDKIEEMFTSGRIDKEVYFELEEILTVNKKLFVICLN